MEYETEKQPGTWDRLKESPRTVSALIIILVVAAAIYAFSGDTNEPGGEEVAEEAAQEESSAAPEATGAGAGAEAGIATPQPVSQETLTQQSEELPEATTTEEGYGEVAQAGDGATHLARRAATRWLSEHTTSYTVTNEHRIFIEDYIQKKMGSPRLEVGESHTISFQVMEEAVAAAGELTPNQLNNLSQYTYVLS